MRNPNSAGALRGIVHETLSDFFISLSLPVF